MSSIIIINYNKHLLKLAAFSAFDQIFFHFRDTDIFYYANEESDDVINCSAKRVKYGSKNISGNVSAMVFKLDTSTLQLFYCWSCVN